MSYSAPKTIRPTTRVFPPDPSTPPNHTVESLTQERDLMRGNLGAVNPFDEQVLPPSTRRKGLPTNIPREHTESFPAATIDDPSTHSAGPNIADHSENPLNQGHVDTTPRRKTPSPQGASNPPFTGPSLQTSPSKNPFHARTQMHSTQSYMHPKPVLRVPPPTFTSSNSIPRESIWAGPTNSSQSQTQSRSPVEGSDASIDGATLQETWPSGVPDDSDTVQHSDDDGEIDLEAGGVSPTPPLVDSRAYPFANYQHAQRAMTTTVGTTTNGQSPIRYHTHDGLGSPFEPSQRLSLRTEDVPLPDSDEVESPHPLGEASPSPSQRFHPAHSSPLRRRSTDFVVAPSSPGAVDLIVQPSPSAKNLNNRDPPVTRERKLPTPPASRELATPPNPPRRSPTAVSNGINIGTSHHTPLQATSISTPYHVPPTSSGKEDTPTHPQQILPQSSSALRHAPSPLAHEDATPAETRQLDNRQGGQAQTNASSSRGNAPRPGPIPDRSLPLREDDYRARSAHPQQTYVPSVNWYQPPLYAPLEYVPDFVYLDHPSFRPPGSPTPSSTIMNNITDQELSITTPRSPLTSLPAYDYPQERYHDDGRPKDEPRSQAQFGPADVQHALWVLEQQRALYAPQPRPHYIQASNTPNFEVAQTEDRDRPASSTSSHQYSHVRPDAPVPPTPQSGPRSTVATPYPVVFSPAPYAHRPDLLRNFRNYSQPLPSRRTYFPGGPRIFPPSLPSTAMSSPFATPINPFLPPVRPTSTVVSSPSHQPIPLPTRRRPRTLSKPKIRKGHQPPRVASTLPPSSDTADDVANDDDDDDDDDGELTEGRIQPSIVHPEDEDEESDVWIKEDKDDRLDLEYHPSHISGAAKRRRRFQEKWEELVGLFNILDRDTDATMLLFAAHHDTSPPGTHMVASRAIRRTPALMASAHRARSAFSDISSTRRRTKVEEARLEKQRQDELDSVASETSDMRRTLANIEAMALRAESQGGEAGLKSALRATLDGLRQMQKINEERENRRRDEAARQRREAAHIEELLQTALSGNAL